MEHLLQSSFWKFLAMYLHHSSLCHFDCGIFHQSQRRCSADLADGPQFVNDFFFGSLVLRSFLVGSYVLQLVLRCRHARKMNVFDCNVLLFLILYQLFDIITKRDIFKNIVFNLENYCKRLLLKTTAKDYSWKLLQKTTLANYCKRLFSKLLQKTCLENYSKRLLMKNNVKDLYSWKLL